MLSILFNKLPLLNSSNEWKFTPLHHAAKKSNLRLCRLFLENTNNKNPASAYKGCCLKKNKSLHNKTKKDNSGCTPLDFAVNKNASVEVLRLLMAHTNDETALENAKKLIKIKLAKKAKKARMAKKGNALEPLPLKKGERKS